MVSRSTAIGLVGVGVALAIYFASSGIESLRIGLNRAYGVAEHRAWWVLRLESIGYVLLAALGLLALSFLVVLAPLIFACALAGGLAFAFVGGIGAALSLGARRGGLLTAVIVLPLFVPPVIFGGGALDAFAGGLPWKAGFALLGGYAAAAVALGPLAMAAACRNALS